MANVFSQNPIVLDTAWTAGSPPAALSALGTNARFRKIIWDSPANNGDAVVFADQNGNTLLSFHINTNNVGESQVLHAGPDPVKWPMVKASGTGWALTTISSGKVYLYK